MKLRLLSFILAILLCFPFGLTACQNEPTDVPDEPSTQEPSDAPETEDEGQGEQEPADEPENEPENEPFKNTAPTSLDVNGDGAIKILSLGNSFTVNTYKYFHQILTAEGVENVTLGNLYQPSCSLDKVASFLNGNGAYASYYKYNTEGVRTETKNYSPITAIQEEDWDIITVQQVSGDSGQVNTFYPILDYIKVIIQENRTVKDGLLMWHMTWAYQHDATNEKFALYNNDQMTMYNSIVEAMTLGIAADPDFDMIIPAGTAIQNARTALGDTLTQDGYHLNPLGCYIAGYAWYTSLTGKTLDELKFAPTDFNLTDAWRNAALKSANAVVDTPLAVTDIAE
ncbi:MAG: DUF4886 domain-containing protein [Clostridia bacterium]|nr:DUF4886 domain-containing protein [Clostridia bacterium]